MTTYGLSPRENRKFYLAPVAKDEGDVRRLICMTEKLSLCMVGEKKRGNIFSVFVVMLFSFLSPRDEQ